MSGTPDSRLGPGTPRLMLRDAAVVLMPHRGGPAMVHGIASPDALPGLGSLYDAAREGTRIAPAAAWSLDGGRPVAAVRVDQPVALDLVLVPDLEEHDAAALGSRPLVTASLYPSEQAREEAMADFRMGGVLGRWERLGVHLPATDAAPLRAG